MSCIQAQPLAINYARVAKRIDVKKVKGRMWSLIETSSAEQGVSNIVLLLCKPEAPVLLLSVNHYFMFVYIPMQNAGGLCAPASFQHLCENVSKGQSESMTRNLSVPICFVCLLHLANEKASTEQLALCVCNYV